MKKILILMCILSLTGCSYRQLQTSLVVTAVADDISTRVGVSMGAEEANGLYAGHNQTRNTLLRLALTGAQLGIGEYLHHNYHEDVSKFFLYAANLANLATLTNNIRVCINLKIKM